MSVDVLGDELAFPPPERATEDGVVAVGGDVNPQRLLLAYQLGIFPWPVRGYPLLWFSPDPRFVLVPDELHLGRSLRKQLRRDPFEIRADTCFREVMTQCALTPRPDQSGTWITRDLLEGYTGLHELGYAHSIEAFDGDTLVGGLYGVSLGRAFFGESMFAHAPDASKVAFVTLVEQLRRWGFDFIDCQVPTDHLARFGAREWSRVDFLSALQQALHAPTRRGPWTLDVKPSDAVTP